MNRSEIECFSLVGENLLVGGDEQGYLIVMDLEAGELVSEKVGHKDRIYKMNCYGNSRVCTSSADHTAKIWSLTIF